MFTERRAFLSRFADASGITVVRDAKIAFAGKIPTSLTGRVVPAATSAHLESARGYSGVAAFVVPRELADQVPIEFGLATSDAPQTAVAIVQAQLADLPDFQWDSFESRIDPSVRVETGAVIAPRDVVIGAHTHIGPNVVILPRTVIGAHCSIGPGTVVGADAFEIMPDAQPRRVMPQSGGVKIGDHVTIQAKCTIIRSTFGGFTTIGNGTMLDCQIHVAHDCKIGEQVTLTACAELSGRVTVGNHSFLGPNCSVSNGVTIGEGAFITIGSVVVRDVDPKAHVTGNFALPHEKWLNFIKTFR